MKYLAVTFLILMVFFAGCSEITITPEGQEPTAVPTRTVTGAQVNQTPAPETTTPVVEISFDKRIYAAGEQARIKVILPTEYYLPSVYDYEVIVKDNYGDIIFDQIMLFSTSSPHTGVLSFTWNESHPEGIYYGMVDSFKKSDGQQATLAFITVKKIPGTAEPTTVPPTPTPTPIPTITIAPTLTVVVINTSATPVPTPSLKGQTAKEGKFVLYSDSDFKMMYLDNWTVEGSETTTSTNQIGGIDKFKPKGRVVVFQSENRSLNFTATTLDYIVKDTYNLDQKITYWQSTITPRFYDVSGTALTNFEVKFTPKFQTQYVTFDVIIPQGSWFYPHAYTERDLVSYSHSYNFRFNTGGNLDDYKQLKQIMLDSIVTEERMKVV